MPAIKTSVPHNLSPAEARNRITQLLTRMRQQFSGMITDVEENWIENKGQFRFSAMGFPITGTLQVEPSVVIVEINLPFAALPFKNKIESEISNQARALLA